MSPETFTREAALGWMRAALRDVAERGADAEHADLIDCGEVLRGALAERAAAAFGVDGESGDPAAPAPLDDDGHWVWEVAIEAAEEFEAGPGAGGGYAR